MNIELNPDVERMVNYFVSAGNANAQVVGQRKSPAATNEMKIIIDLNRGK